MSKNSHQIYNRELIKFTQRLIQTPSLSREEEVVAKVVAEEMRHLNYDEVWIDEKNNVVGRIKGEGKGPTLMFNGHIDHAGVGDMFEPFSGKLMDGSEFGCQGEVIYGRGASDMKAAIAAMVYAASAIKSQGTPLKGDVLITAVALEEPAYGEGIKYLLEEKGITADFAVSGEATNLNVYIGHRGKAEFKVTTKGRTSHGGYPQAGINAISLMNRFINAVEEKYFLPSDDVFGDATYTFIDIAASPGRLTPIVPDRCEIIFDRRFFPGESTDKLASEIWNIIEELKMDPNFDAEVELVKLHPPMYTEPEERIVKAMQTARKKVMGEQSKLGTWFFGVDGTFLNLYGIPCVGFGPADEHMAHTPNDHVPVDQIITAFKVYRQLIEDLCT